VRKPGVTEGAYDRTPVAAVEQLAILFSVTRRHLADITAPVTLYWSPEDHILPRSSARILRRGLEPHLLTTVILEQSFHAATLDYDAPLIDQDSITTLQKLSRGQHDTAWTRRARTVGRYRATSRWHLRTSPLSSFQ